MMSPAATPMLSNTKNLDRVADMFIDLTCDSVSPSLIIQFPLCIYPGDLLVSP